MFVIILACAYEIVRYTFCNRNKTKQKTLTDGIANTIATCLASYGPIGPAIPAFAVMNMFSLGIPLCAIAIPTPTKSWNGFVPNRRRILPCCSVILGGQLSTSSPYPYPVSMRSPPICSHCRVALIIGQWSLVQQAPGFACVPKCQHSDRFPGAQPYPTTPNPVRGMQRPGRAAL